MARYTATCESPAALPAGTTLSTTNTQGYFAALVAGTAMGCTIRRIQLGVRVTTAATAATSQQVQVGLFRQLVRGVAGTGITTATASAAGALEPSNTATSGIAGLDVMTTATPALTTAPTLSSASNPLYRLNFNTQSMIDLPFEGVEMLRITPASANASGLAFINLGNALPAAHVYVLTVEWEE